MCWDQEILKIPVFNETGVIAKTECTIIIILKRLPILSQKVVINTFVIYDVFIFKKFKICRLLIKSIQGSPKRNDYIPT